MTTPHARSIWARVNTTATFLADCVARCSHQWRCVAEGDGGHTAAWDGYIYVENGYAHLIFPAVWKRSSRANSALECSERAPNNLASFPALLNLSESLVKSAHPDWPAAKVNTVCKRLFYGCVFFTPIALCARSRRQPVGPTLISGREGLEIQTIVGPQRPSTKPRRLSG